jgi:hypothetical protein
MNTLYQNPVKPSNFMNLKAFGDNQEQMLEYLLQRS